MGIKLSKEQRRLFETFLFLAKLIVLAIPLYLIMGFQDVLLPLQEVVTQNVQFILKSLGFEVLRNGFLLKADGIVFLISEDCTGWKSMLFLSALMLAVPSVVMKKRIIGLLLGIPVIYAGNILRILVMVFVWKVYGYEVASIVHIYFWQLGLISLVLVLWLSWLIWSGKIKITFLKRLHKLIKPR